MTSLSSGGREGSVGVGGRGGWGGGGGDGTVKYSQERMLRRSIVALLTCLPCVCLSYITSHLLHRFNDSANKIKLK